VGAARALLSAVARAVARPRLTHVLLLPLCAALLCLHTGDKLQLQGLCAFDAAVHCASMTGSTAARHHSDKGGRREGGVMQRLFQRVVNIMQAA
jgi:hypothetical protein